MPISFKLINIELLRYIGIGFTSIGSFLIIILAPVDNINHPFGKSEKKKFRKKTFLFTLFAIIIFVLLVSFPVTSRYAFVIGYVMFVVSLALVFGVIKNNIIKDKAKYTIKDITDKNLPKNDILISNSAKNLAKN